MTITTTAPTLELALEQFLRWLQARNRSELTQSAYRTDLSQFIDWIHANNATIAAVDHVARVDVREYLACLGEKKLSGGLSSPQAGRDPRIFPFRAGRSASHRPLPC